MAGAGRTPFSDHPLHHDDDDDFMDIDSLDDAEFAFQLQLQEALTASLSLSPQPSSSARVPFAGGSSSSAAASMDSEEFRLYFKGFVSEEQVGDRKLALAGIGVAICDFRDNLVFEVKKPLIGNGLCRISAQMKALIEGLTAAVSLGLERITFFCDNYPIFQFVNGKWSSKQRKVVGLVNEVKSLRSKFTQCNSRLVPWMEIKFAVKLARDAIESQSQMRNAELTTGKNLKGTCVICMEDSDVSQMFSVDGCLHRYCFSCMKQHVEVKLLHGLLPKCPHEECKSDLGIDSCAKFLTPKLVETMSLRIKEASIPVMERVYCPYPRCSFLMSKTEVLQHAKETLRGAATVERSGLRRCMKCDYLFCINCKVHWHRGITCKDYKRSNPNPPEEDTKLKHLASSKLWRQCVKCSQMIELLEGCYHMTCRCNYEFCYNCGAEWKDKKPTCTCPLWLEDNILHEDVDDDGEAGAEPREDAHLLLLLLLLFLLLLLLLLQLAHSSCTLCSLFSSLRSCSLKCHHLHFP